MTYKTKKWAFKFFLNKTLLAYQKNFKYAITRIEFFLINIFNNVTL